MKWTVEDANAALPRVHAVLDEALVHQEALRDALAHIEDMRIVHGPGIESADNPEREAYLDAMAKAMRERTAIEKLLQGLSKDGIHVKDVDTGLIDFVADLGGKTVYLCHKRGEDRVGHWHTLQGGFAARQPLPELGFDPGA